MRKNREQDKETEGTKMEVERERQVCDATLVTETERGRFILS